MHRFLRFVLWSVLLAACADERGVPDAAEAEDATAEDAAAKDATIDAGERDAGEADAGLEADSGVDSGVDDMIELVFRVRAPTSTPPGDTIYVAGTFQGWDPGAAAYALEDLGGQTHAITLTFEPGTEIEFKFTRGTWATVEASPSGVDIPNRMHRADADATLDLVVANWIDRPSTVVGDVRTSTLAGFLGGRRFWIYLPPGYANGSERYRVLYMLDGQNLFDAFTSFSGEWEVDETLERGIPARAIAPIIVVGIDNAGAGRLDEYTPWYDEGYGAGGGAGAFVDAVADVLRPHIDRTHRTLTGPENTGIAGSSLGGLVTLYATYARPDVFGKNAAFSPSIWWADRQILSFVQSSVKPPSRIWMDMGTDESADAIPNLRLMRDTMVGQGFMLGVDLTVVEDPGAAHNEAAWARRFPLAMEFLFPPP